MNYRHYYHAGNFADVFKHLILMRLIKHLLVKEKPLCYLDTHAGAGLYDLSPLTANRDHESELGIKKLIQLPSLDLPSTVKDYVDLVKVHYPFYPGSSFIAKTLLRKEDRLILFELHPEEYRALKQTFKDDKRIAIHHQDGYQAISGFLPPKERRGLIFIDPAFEQKDELDSIINTLSTSIRKFPNGIYVLWYPIKDRQFVKKLSDAVSSLGSLKLLKAELSIYSADAVFNLIGSGMMIINSPWQFLEELSSWVPWLWEKLSINKAGGYSLQ